MFSQSVLRGLDQLDNLSLVLFLLFLLSLASTMAFIILLLAGRKSLARARDRWSDLTMRVITDALPCKVCYLDRAGVLIHSNHLGLERFFGKPIDRLLAARTDRIFLEHFQACLNGEVISVEMPSIFDRSRIDQVRLVPHRGDHHEIVGVICVTTDVTDYREIEKELSAAKEAADSANAAKSLFLANMSHEIRTPLSAVLGFSDLLVQPNLLPEDRQRYIGAIKRNGILLKSLIDDILDISKVESGMMTLEIQMVNLSDIISDIISHLGVQAAAKDNEIILKPSPELPTHIKSDPTRLRQILINIVGNAVKFTDAGRVEVIIEAVAGTSLLAFHVKDSGCGISQIHARDLFNPFYQGDSATKRQYGGTGLGLVLARRFARMLGGDVILTRSSPGQGSIFTITIDSAMPENRSYQPASAESEMGFAPDPHALYGVSILLVEDALDNQLLIGTYLQSAGADFEIANNGLEALSKIEKSEFDLVIMDIQMPIMDGYETAEELRLRGYDVPLIALTAHTMREERERCLARGFEDHIGKPINPQLLIETIRRLVTTHQNRQVFFGRDPRLGFSPLAAKIPRGVPSQ